jgi:hypothetical protein
MDIEPLKLKLPPGFYANGTDYQAAGRWHTGDLIRWFNDHAKTIFGWQIRSDLANHLPLPPLWGDGTATEAARSAHAVQDGSGGVNAFVGTNKKIYMLTNTNVVSDVTPAGFVAKEKSASFQTGYGLFRYSYGKYGTPRPAGQGIPPNVFTWGFSNWGFWPIVCARDVAGEKLKVKRTSDATFVDIANSPAGTFDAVVTDERIVMTFGNQTDYRKVQWSARENFDVWTPAIDNQAGGQTLAGGGKLLRGVKVLGQVLILSENDAFSARYVGPPYVYGFKSIGSRCGVIGPNAVSVTDKFAAWAGARSFWLYDGTLQQIPCDILDFYLDDHNKQQRSKTVALTISDYNEIWWLYQSNESVLNEPDSYIVYNYAQKIWYSGRIHRTTGFDADPLVYPFMVDAFGNIYDHEVEGASHDGAGTPYLASGPLELANGKRLFAVSYVYPDEQLRGNVKMDMECYDLPNDEGSNLLHSMTFDLMAPTSTTGVMARDIRMKLYSSGVSPIWQVGDFRVVPVNTGPMR